MMLQFVILIFCAATIVVESHHVWNSLPIIPVRDNAANYFLQNNGIKGASDIRTSGLVRQNADSRNTVLYTANRIPVNIKYPPLGVQGFIPNNVSPILLLERPPAVVHPPSYSLQNGNFLPKHGNIPLGFSTLNGEQWSSPLDRKYSSPDKSYSFSYNTGDSSRSETSDANGNVRGQFSYTNNAGNHDLSYIAGKDTGFLPTGGSLSIPNALERKSIIADVGSASSSPSWPDTSDPSSNRKSTSDGSYSYSYNSGDSLKSETADRDGNIQGQYAYTNNAGHHDLSYVAGKDIGFVPTGGSLAVPNGLAGKSLNSGASSSPAVLSDESDTNLSVKPNDGSYSFSYNTGDASRSETADPKGNIQGQYAYANNAGQHDLSYIAGKDIGFVPTGGSLAVPNGLAEKNENNEGTSLSPAWETPLSLVTESYNSENGAEVDGSKDQTDSIGSTIPTDETPTESSSNEDSNRKSTADSSYSFSYSTGDSSKSELADSIGNIQGQYSYVNDAGQHDLSYIAGKNIGFVPTGGSLAVPNGLTGEKTNSGSYSSPATWPSLADKSTNDRSYSFSYNTGDSSRSESADPNGNIQGQYEYTNNVGRHDLSYIAGKDIGFVPTSGSLATPNGLAGKSINVGSSSWSSSSNSENPNRSYLDGKNSGFVTTGGSLAAPNNFANKITPPNIPNHHILPNHRYTGKSLDSEISNPDSSYSFAYDAGNSFRKESADRNGNVKGYYSYVDDAGKHDLSYEARVEDEHKH